MPYNIPATQELVTRNRAQIEAALYQKTPLAEKAFNTVLSTVEAMTAKELYSFAADLIRENLALTASEEGLERMGAEYDVYRVQPAAWQGIASFNIPDGETLYLGTVFIGPQKLEYVTLESVTAPSSIEGEGILVPIACVEAGPSGNLSANDTLTIQTPIAGAARTATVTEVTALGTPVEDLEVYRQRILDIERSEGGGGNSSDLRTWAQEVPGVRRAYPFSGPPGGSGHAPLPGERTVYIECTLDINADGIAPPSLLDLVHKALLTEPETGVSREVLGLTTDTLYVRPIVRTEIYVTISGMGITGGSAGDAEDAIRAALDALFENFAPFVQGLDPEFDRRDEITSSVIGREVQNILDAYGGTACDISFGITPDSFVGRYTLNRNEKLKLARLVFSGDDNA